MLQVGSRFIFCVLLAFASSTGFPGAHAQEDRLPKPATQDPAPLEPTPPPTPITPPAAAELIPADILPLPGAGAPPTGLDIPTIDQLDQAMLPPPPSAAAQAQAQHIEWRKLRNQVQNDPRVKAALAEAEAAKTDLQRRKLLARYYELFHARMIALAPPEMKVYLLARKGAAMAALPQPRVRPETAPPTPTPAKAAASTGVSPSPTPTATAIPTASPTPSKRTGLGLPRP